MGVVVEVRGLGGKEEWLVLGGGDRLVLVEGDRLASALSRWAFRTESGMREGGKVWSGSRR